jgi:hypothetical protein
MTDRFTYIAKVLWKNEDGQIEKTCLAVYAKSYGDAAAQIEQIFGPLLDSMEIVFLNRDYCEISEEDFNERKERQIYG